MSIDNVVLSMPVLIYGQVIILGHQVLLTPPSGEAIQ